MARKKKKGAVENGQTKETELKEEVETSQQENTETAAENESASEQELQELKDKYLRLMAEFDNYKKRTFREKLETINQAARDTVLSILPVLDDFDRAKLMADDASTEEVFSEGVELVYNKLHGVLKGKGLAVMDTNGQPFDPELHEAMTEIPAPSEDLKGHIVDTIEKGYTLNDKIIRHAKVVVGK